MLNRTQEQWLGVAKEEGQLIMYNGIPVIRTGVKCDKDPTREYYVSLKGGVLFDLEPEKIISRGIPVEVVNVRGLRWNVKYTDPRIVPRTEISLNLEVDWDNKTVF